MEQIKQKLKGLNPKLSDCQIDVAATAIALYIEARDNIKDNGAIVLHPKSGAPIENPYLKVLDNQSKFLSKLRNIKTEGIL